MPLPMRPHPNTPTRLMSVMALRTWRCQLASGRRPGHHAGSDLVGEAHERVRAQPGEGVLRADLAALQAVEHLLQPDLYLLVLTPLSAERRPPRAAPPGPAAAAGGRGGTPATARRVRPAAAPGPNGVAGMRSRCRRRL